jgi:predicted glycosyltransferase
MMDYEHQPANHVSFRLARRVIIPTVFPSSALRRYGARESKAIRYRGFKEQLYLSHFRPNKKVVDELGLHSEKVIVVMRPAPEGALYHRMANNHFDELLEAGRRRPDTQVVLLPRNAEDSSRYGALDEVIVPPRPIDALSLLAYADMTIGAGGTMTRESALLGTPTYSVFLGRQAAVDAELIRLGLIRDLRHGGWPAFTKRTTTTTPTSEGARREILEVIRRGLSDTRR